MASEEAGVVSVKAGVASEGAGVVSEEAEGVSEGAGVVWITDLSQNVILVVCT